MVQQKFLITNIKACLASFFSFDHTLIDKSNEITIFTVKIQSLWNELDESL